MDDSRIKTNRLPIENPVDEFIAQLKKSGAKVIVSKNSYYFSKAFGPVSQHLKGKTRREIRKSLAFLRLRKNLSCNIKAKFGVATHAAIFISKEDIIQLQLANQGTFAKLYIDANDIISNFYQADAYIGKHNQPEGYYILRTESLITHRLQYRKECDDTGGLYSSKRNPTSAN